MTYRFGSSESGGSGVTPETQTPYQQGFEKGLVEGYRAAANGSEYATELDAEMAKRRKFLAWSTLFLGLGSVAGVFIARKDANMFNVFAVAGGAMTAIVGAAQVLNDESVPGPLGIR